MIGLDEPIASVIDRFHEPNRPRRGDRSQRPWWRCPFHGDVNPSLGVIPDTERWLVSLWLIGGLMILFLGIIGIYVAKIFLQTKNRPLAIVRQVYRVPANEISTKATALDYSHRIDA